MNRLFTLFLAAAAFLVASCTREGGNSSDNALLLLPAYPSASTASRAGFAQGDVVGVYGVVDGLAFRPSDNPINNVVFAAAVDGLTFSAQPAVCYPDAKQAVHLYSYFPYQNSVADARALAFAVAADQSTPATLKASDLCWGSAATTATAAAVPITYSHLLSKLNVSVSAPAGVVVTQVLLPAIQAAGVLDLQSGIFAPSAARTAVGSAAGELIVPAQSLDRIAIEAAGDTYIYEPATPMVLVAGVSYGVNLTLHQEAGNFRVELSAPVVVAPWTAGSSSSVPSEKVTNSFTAHWLLPHPSYGLVDRVALELVNSKGVQQDYFATNVVLQGGHSSLAASYAFDFAQPTTELSYSYSIASVAFYAGANLVQRASASSIKGLAVYKSGPYTLGIVQEHILELTSGRIVDWSKLAFVGGITGGVLNDFAVELIEPAATYTTITKLKMVIDGVDYVWNAVSIQSGSTALRARLAPFSFLDEATQKTPLVYPYRIERLALMNASGGVVVDFSCGISVTRQGRIALQTY